MPLRVNVVPVGLLVCGCPGGPTQEENRQTLKSESTEPGGLCVWEWWLWGAIYDQCLPSKCAEEPGHWLLKMPTQDVDRWDWSRTQSHSSVMPLLLLLKHDILFWKQFQENLGFLLPYPAFLMKWFPTKGEEDSHSLGEFCVCVLKLINFCLTRSFSSCVSEAYSSWWLLIVVASHCKIGSKTQGSVVVGYRF